MNLDYILLKKKPIKITDKLYLSQHTMEEIEDNIGYSHYEQIVFAATREPYEFKYDFEEINIDYKNITFFTLFQIFSMGDELIEFNNIKISKTERTIQVLNFMFNANFQFAKLTNVNKKNKSDLLALFDINTEDYICADNFRNLKNILAKIFFIQKPKERFAINKMAKELIRRDVNLKKKESIDSDIYSIISSLLWSPNCKETHDSIWKLTPYQIYNGYLTVEKHKNFDNTMSAYYHGMIDKKDLNIKNIHWIKKISLKEE